MFLFIRIWYSNYRNLQYWLSSNHVLIIIQSYDVHHVQESQSDGMDHQWFQNTILLHIKKMTFLYIISHNIYYYHLSPWYILWCRNATTLIMRKKSWFPFILMLSDQNKMGLKYQPGCFTALHLSLSWYLMSIPLVWWFNFTFKLRFFSLMDYPFI